MKKIVIFVVFICNMLQAEETLFLVNNRHMECIETILYSLSEKSTGSLVFDAFHLRSIGKEIEIVPPLNFLYVVLQKPILVNYLKNTRGRYFQWNAFISGFRDKCNKPNVYRKIKKSLNVFAEELDVEVKELEPFITNKNWQGFVEYLLKRR